MVKIAIIDSGIKKNSYINKKYVKMGINIFLENGKIYLDEDYDDENGHGYFCAQVIMNQCVNVEFYIIRILNNKIQGNSECLAYALEYLLQYDIQIINLSLAIFDTCKYKCIENLCGKLFDKGIIIVSSVANHNKTSFPACLNSVYGVKGNNGLSEEVIEYRRNEKIHFVTSITPVLVEDIKGNYTFFGGNSKAAALFTGIIANKISNNISFNPENMAKAGMKCIHKKEKLIANYINDEKLTLLLDIITSVYKLNSEQKKLLFYEPLYSEKFNLKRNSIEQLINAIMKNSNVKLKIGQTTFNIFESIYTLYEAVYGDDICES